MAKVIIYPNPNNNEKIVIVTPYLNCGLTIEQIAAKDVPPNTPYLIVDTDQFPSNINFSDAWEADFSSPHGVGANFGIGSFNAVVEWNGAGTPIIRQEDKVQ
jgi:hypothetical protein